MSKLLIIMLVSIFLTHSQNSKLSYTAETLEGFKSGDLTGRKLIGNVEMWQDSINIFCDSAVYIFETNNAKLFGNVEILQDSLKIFSDYINYNGNTKVAFSPGSIILKDLETILEGDQGKYDTREKRADFNGNVIVDDDTSRIYCDKLIHYRIDEVSYTFGNVFLQAKQDRIYLTADTIENYGTAKITFAYGKPKLFKIDSIKTDHDSLSIELDTMTVSSMRMEALREVHNNSFFFFDSVEIYRESVQSFADTVNYQREIEKTLLSGSPVIFYENSQLIGDSIAISMKGNKLEEIKAISNSISISVMDSNYRIRKDQITGDTVLLKFKDNDIEAMFARGSSKLLYFVTNEDKQPDGANLFSSESIDIFFDEDSASELNLYRDDGGESPQGNTYPEFMINGSEVDLYLPLYKWKEKKPKKYFLDYPEKNLKMEK